MVEHLSAMWETWVRSLGREDSLEEADEKAMMGKTAGSDNQLYEQSLHLFFTIYKRKATINEYSHWLGRKLLISLSLYL